MHARRRVVPAPRDRCSSSTNDTKQPGVRAAANEALGVARGNLHARERIAATGLVRHVLLERPAGEMAARLPHVADDAVPRADELTAVDHLDAVLRAVELPALHEIRQQRAEQLELPL